MATADNNAVTGAQSVADAVRRVADAAVAEVSRVQNQPAGPTSAFTFTGTPGGGFTIRGQGFGASGTVKVGGVQVRTTGWSTTEIHGTLPANVGSGEVVVQVDEKTALRGQFVKA